MEGKRIEDQKQHDLKRGNLSAAKYLGVTLLNGLITGVEVAGGIMSGSLALLSDAAHNLGDTVSILLSFVAWKIAGKEKDVRRTYGFKRAEIIAAFVNASVLVAISLYLVLEAVRRFRKPETIDGGLMIGVALFGLVANFVSMRLLKREAHGNMNVRSSYLHLLGDAVSSVGVLGGGIAIRVWGLFWIDPLVSLGIAVYVMRESWVIVKNSVGILMQSAADLDYSAMQREIEALPEVRNIHHVHTWMANEETVYFEAHIDMEDCLLSRACVVAEKIEGILKERFGISHVTLQFETGRCQEKDFFKIGRTRENMKRSAKKG
jgi:cobalt-zinc-cadmium efflux system protein